MAVGHFIGQHDQPSGMSDEQLQALKDYFGPVVELAKKQLEWMAAEEARRAESPATRPAAESVAADPPTDPPPKDEGSGAATGG